MSEVNLSSLFKLQASLDHDSAYLIEDTTDLFYLLKKPISLGSLIIEKNNIHLFVDGRYFSAFSGLEKITTLPSEKEGLYHYLMSSNLKTVVFDSAKTTYERALFFKKFQKIHFVPQKELLRLIRIIKSPHEIALIRQSSQLLVSIYKEFLTLPKIGLSEKEISRQFQLLSIEKGAEGFSFEPIMASGPNTAFPHHRPQNRHLESSDVLLVDVGVTKNYYQSDMTRMVFLGHAPSELLFFHDCVLEAHQAALNVCKPGVACGQLDQAARDVFRRHNLEHLFCHSLGHGLGLETHEAPRLKFDGADKDIILEPGMVITIEPGLYKEGLGGIRHEDLIVITETGYENFYPNYI
jgi:Xaa-Pro aminopeptidase